MNRHSEKKLTDVYVVKKKKKTTDMYVIIKEERKEIQRKTVQEIEIDNLIKGREKMMNAQTQN